MKRNSLTAAIAFAMFLGMASMASALQVPSLNNAPSSMPFMQPSTPAPAPMATPAPQPTAPAPQANGSSCGCGPVCQPQMIERTIYVPTPSYEKRTIQCVQYSNEQREKQVTVLRMVPETKPVTQQYCVMIPEKRQRTENYTACKPVQVECKDCNGCVCGTTCQYVQEPRQRVIEYTVCIPQMKTRTVNVTTCKYVPEQKTVTVNVCVPHTVEKQVDVCVYHMVARKVLCPAPTCYMPSCGVGGCW